MAAMGYAALDMIHGMSRFASAAAGLSCRFTSAQTGIPALNEIESCL